MSAMGTSQFTCASLSRMVPQSPLETNGKPSVIVIGPKDEQC